MLCINKLTADPVVDYAAQELKKYLRMMMPEGGDVGIGYDPSAASGFRLGLMGELGLDISDVADAALDDVIYIDCDADGGVIAGSNPRSVLLAVYGYLRENGCRWLFPGIDGEYIPMKDISPVKYRHKANMRYRGNCIEGSVNQQILNDYIDFMPKVGLNTFMLQFRVPEVFYERYFGKSDRVKLRENETVSDNTILAWTRLTECEMAKRGIMLHSYGHGFTADPFCKAPSHSGWGTSDISVVPEEKRDFLALVNGKRDFIIGRPNNTNFCMSNPAARREVVKYIVGYAEKHSNTDFLHVWLADGMNNHCECDGCSKKRPSDFYVMLMNELDEELTQRRIDMRIVFIVYVDTSWAPEREVIKNPDRFTLMLAPITRDYNFTLKGDETVEVLPYVRNKLSMPRNLAEYLAYFDEWKKCWSGSNVCFEYHFWLPMNSDLSGIKIAERVFEDVRLYKARGFDGIINCGTQRCFFPHGLAFYTYARALFDGAISFGEICDDYFMTAFGDGADEFKSHLSALEEAFPYSHFYKVYSNENFYSPELAEKIKGIPRVVESLLESVKGHKNSEDRIKTVSLRMLEYYSEYALKISEIAVAKALGNNDEARRIFDEFLPRYVSFELYFMNYVDMHQSVRVMRHLVNCSSEADGAEKKEICIV